MISYKSYESRSGKYVVKTTIIPGELFASKVTLRKVKKQGVKKPKIEKKKQHVKQVQLDISRTNMLLRMWGIPR